MTIGILGDFYINFGWWGSIIGLFIFGALISRFLFYFQVKFVKPDPINIIWVPYMLSYFVRADNDFYIMFNCMFKGFLIFLFVRFLEKNIWQESKVKDVHFSK